MKQAAFLTLRRSPLQQAQSLKGESKNARVKELGLALPLTSLIDAFCIIVIYLLIGTQSTGIETKVPGQLQLPTAENAQSVEKETATLRIEKGNYFLNNQAIGRSLLSSKLSQLKKSSTEAVELLIQADTEMAYADLDPLIKAGAEAGIEKLRFAVIPTR